MYQNIPMELRELPQWVCWRYELVNGRQTKVPYRPDGQFKADVNDPGTWGTFAQACSTALGPTMHGIGMVLTERDPYTGIDIDNKPENPASEPEREVQRRVLEAFQSYTERSVGGSGYHIIIRGKVQGGRDRGHIGVYSTQRYLTFTGDVVRNAPIADYQSYLDALVAGMPGGQSVELEEVEAVIEDDELHEMALRAANGDKYDALTKGDWQAMGYPSQSEADFALLSIIAFYTRDNEQVRRLFRMTRLGKREKALRDNRYLNAALAKIRAKEPTQGDYEAGKAAAEAILQAAFQEDVANNAGHVEVVNGNQTLTMHMPKAAPARVDASGSYTLPPGMVGELAQYFHSTAVRPVQEMALAAAIGIMAGIVGRSYNVSGTGLNQYLLFVAKTGTGKEGGPRGIESLLAAVRGQVPMVDEFVGPGAFASGQAMIRVLDAKPCFLSILGEFGLTLQALNDPRAPAAVVMLKRVLLDLYAKSGWNNVLRSTAYSDAEKNTKTIHAPNVSFLGDATPETFYDGISGADIADGLIPRLQIIEYKGQRPARNRNAGHPPSAELANKFAELVALALSTRHNNTCAAVQLAPDALVAMDAFDEYCDNAIRGAHNAGETQLWNRAHLKALKLAGLIAVGVDPHAPCITPEIAEWAIAFTRRSTETVLSRFETGDVGNGDAKQASELRRVVQEYFKLNKKELETYKVKPELQKAGLVPYAYLVMRLSRTAAFYKDRAGAVRALKNTIEAALQTEQLAAMVPGDALTKFNSRQALYFLGPNW